MKIKSNKEAETKEEIAPQEQNRSKSYGLFKKTVEISTQMGCANNCSYCPQKLFVSSYFLAHQKTESKLSFENFKKYLSKIPKEITITFSGMTEPFFNPEALDMVEYAVNEGRIVSVNTTLRGMSKEEIDRLISLDIKYFAIHTPDADRNIKLEASDEYLENLEYFYKKSDINKTDYLVIGKADQKVKKILGDDLCNLPICTRADNLDLKNDNPDIIQKPENNYALNVPVICGCKFNDGDSEDPFKIEKSILLPDGSLILCCNDYAIKHILGNLKHNTYEEIMSGEEMTRIIASMKCENDYCILCRTCDKGVVYDPVKWENFKKYGRYEIFDIPRPVKKLPFWEKIFSIRNEECYKVIRCLGIKKKIKKRNYTVTNINNTYNNNYTDDKELYSKIKFLSVVQQQHQKTFPQFKNINFGKDVVLCASGPSLSKYSSMENAVHIGVNGVIFNEKVKLDYLFINDYDFMRKFGDAAQKYQGNNCKKFYAILSTLQYRIPEIEAMNAGAYRYYTNYPEENINYEIDSLPLADFNSVIFAAFNFALWTHPKKIYLVGCDCSSGYYDNEPRTVDFYKIISDYKKFKEFIKINYPDIEIVSINPVGLRGIFKDSYTNEKELLHENTGIEQN